MCRSNADPTQSYLAGIVSHGEGNENFLMAHFKEHSHYLKTHFQSISSSLVFVPQAALVVVSQVSIHA